MLMRLVRLNLVELNDDKDLQLLLLLAHQHFRFNDDAKSDIPCYGFHFSVSQSQIMMMKLMGSR